MLFEMSLSAAVDIQLYFHAVVLIARKEEAERHPKRGEEHACRHAGSICAEGLDWGIKIMFAWPAANFETAVCALQAYSDTVSGSTVVMSGPQVTGTVKNDF